MRSEGQVATGRPAPGTTLPRRRQAERTALSEGRLLAAALQLISERGYDRMTLQGDRDAEPAKEPDVSSPACAAASTSGHTLPARTPAAIHSATDVRSAAPPTSG